MQQQLASTRRPGSVSALGWAVLAGCAVAMACAAPDAHAVTLTNKDSKTHSVEVRVKSSRREHELAPGNSLKGFCEAGCIIRLNGSADHDFILEGSERVSIEGGLVYYDGEEIKPKDDAAASGKADK